MLEDEHFFVDVQPALSIERSAGASVETAGNASEVCRLIPPRQNSCRVDRTRSLGRRRGEDVARYGKEYKDRVVARLLPPESAPVERVSAEVGVSALTLGRWLAEALESASGGGEPARRVWTAAARLQAVIATASLDETAKSAWCREQEGYPQELTQWSASALDALADPKAASSCASNGAERLRVKELERELRLKALAEAAALLVLSKKLSAIFQEDTDE